MHRHAGGDNSKEPMQAGIIATIASSVVLIVVLCGYMVVYLITKFASML